MKTFRLIAPIATLAFLTAASCSKDNSTNMSSSSMGVKIQATNAVFPMLKSTAASFTWDSATMVVSKLELEAEKGDSLSKTEISFEWTGPKTIDLLHVDALVADIPLQPGMYHEVSVKVNAYAADAGNVPVFYLSGTYVNGTGTRVPVNFTVNEDLEFRAKAEGSALNAIKDYTSLITLDLSTLFSGISTSLLDAAVLTDGKLVISTSSNKDLYDALVASFAHCAGSRVAEGRNHDFSNDHGTEGGGSHGSY